MVRALTRTLYSEGNFKIVIMFVLLSLIRFSPESPESKEPSSDEGLPEPQVLEQSF